MATSMNTGKVKFFNEAKGYGFLTDSTSGKDIFFHFSGVIDIPVKKDDLVDYLVEEGPKGLKATSITKSI